MQIVAWRANLPQSKPFPSARPRCRISGPLAIAVCAAALLTPQPLDLAARPPRLPPTGEEPADDTPRPLNFEPLEFDGVQPGVSTIAEVREAWGEPTQTSEKTGVVRHVYQREPFKRLVVMFHKGKVLSITVQLEVPLVPRDVAEQLRLAGAGVTIYDDAGNAIGIAFPEHGATLRLAPRSPTRASSDMRTRRAHDSRDASAGQRAIEILLGEIDAEPFVLRAESLRTTNDTLALADLAAALALDDKLGRAHWLRARILLELGRRRQALEAVELAARLEPKQPEYKLTRARILSEECRFDEATALVEQAISLCGARPEIKALALSRAGELSAAGPRRDFQRSVELAQQAIDLAEPLAGKGRVAVRSAAREALIEAHLAAAHGVAWGRFKRKGEAVELWLGKAQAIVQESIDEHGLDPDWELRLCSRALGALVGTAGKIDPGPWARRALDVGRRRIEATDDPLHRRRLAWELGLALYDALQTFQTRREFEPALEYGKRAVSYIEEGRAGRDEAPGDAYLLGRLYFRMGLIEAEHRQEHAQAVEWYDRAVPLIEKPLPDSALADVGRQGESLAAAAVSYWQTGDRDRAVRLTNQAAALMVQAVEQDIIGQQSLAVVYANLASMHRTLGQRQEADRYALKAAELER